MNRARNYMKLLFCLSFLFLMLSTGVLANDSGEIRRIGYESLTDKQKLIYERLVKGIAEKDKTIQLRSSASKSDIKTAFKMMKSDYPELFYLDSGYSYKSGKDAYVKPRYLDIQDQQEAVDAAIAEILSGMPHSADTDYEKALYLHDALAAWTEYGDNSYDQSAYSALVLRSTACAGYTHAYQLLLNKVGIPSLYIGGVLGDPTSTSRHAWNQVWIDDQCVYTDVTWDDTGDRAYYGLFNLSLEQMYLLGHYPDSEYSAVLPPCNHDLDLRSDEEYTTHIVDASVTGAELASKATIFTKNDFVYATVYFLCQDENTDYFSLISRVMHDFRATTNGDSIVYSCPSDPSSDSPCMLHACSGVGGTYKLITDNILRFWIPYHSSVDYTLLVAYYAEDGRMLETATKDISKHNGEVVFACGCPDNFAECRIFLINPENGAPLCSEPQLIEQ